MWMLKVTIVTLIASFALAGGTIGLAGTGAVAALATGSAASEFELTFQGVPEVVPSPASPFVDHVGTFKSGGPFCESGTGVHLVGESDFFGVSWGARLYTCADGSGSLTISVSRTQFQHEQPWDMHWRIVEGTGSYANLEGRGTLSDDLRTDEAGQPLGVSVRSTLRGVADNDAVAPSIELSRIDVTKLRRPVGAFRLDLVLAMHDDVEGNPVGYALSVRKNGLELARRVGSTATGTVPLTLRIRRPNANVRAVRVQVTAVDPVGNERSVSQLLRLPR